MLNAIPSSGLFVHRNLTFHLFFSGLPLPTSHSLYNFKLYSNDAISINVLLQQLKIISNVKDSLKVKTNITVPVLYKPYPNSSLTELQIR